MLADVRLTTREACYNTVRNVTACPLAGSASRGAFRRAAVRAPPGVRVSAQGTDRQSAAQVQGRVLRAARRTAWRRRSTTSACGAVIRDGERGFRMTVAGGLGPLPTEAQAAARVHSRRRRGRRVEAVIRVFNRHGNRKNKNKARLKFVMRERGFDWLRDTIEEEYQDILANGGIPMPEEVPEGFGGFQPHTTTARDRANCCRCSNASPEFQEWRETNVAPQKQRGLRDRHGDDSAGQPDRRSDARPGRACPSRRATGRCASP